jgi:hypothetical protein
MMERPALLYVLPVRIFQGLEIWVKATPAAMGEMHQICG